MEKVPNAAEVVLDELFKLRESGYWSEIYHSSQPDGYVYIVYGKLLSDRSRERPVGKILILKDGTRMESVGL